MRGAERGAACTLMTCKCERLQGRVEETELRPRMQCSMADVQLLVSWAGLKHLNNNPFLLISCRLAGQPGCYLHIWVQYTAPLQTSKSRRIILHKAYSCTHCQLHCRGEAHAGLPEDRQAVLRRLPACLQAGLRCVPLPSVHTSNKILSTNSAAACSQLTTLRSILPAQLQGCSAACTLSVSSLQVQACLLQLLHSGCIQLGLQAGLRRCSRRGSLRPAQHCGHSCTSTRTSTQSTSPGAENLPPGSAVRQCQDSCALVHAYAPRPPEWRLHHAALHRTR